MVKKTDVRGRHDSEAGRLGVRLSGSETHRQGESPGETGPQCRRKD